LQVKGKKMITLNGTTGITSTGGYTGDGIVLADGTPSNTLVTTTGGNVGVGTATPNQKLVVANSAATYIQASNTSGTPSNIFLGAAGGDNVIISRDGTTGNKPLSFYVGTEERARIDSSGNFLVGTSTSPGSPNAQIVVSGTADAGIQIASTNGGGNLILAPGGAGAAFYTYTGAVGSESYSERMRIDSSGNLLVGTTSSPSGLTSPRVGAVTGNESAFYGVNNASDSSYVVTLWNKATSGGRRMMRFNAGSSETEVGTIIFNGSSTVYATSSDYRLKDITGAITATEAKDFIMALQPKQGTWKADGSKFVGFLAHEFQEVSPSSVTGKKDAVDKDGNPEYQGMQAASSEVMANLIALVQEQQALITQLQADVAALKGAA
jgi:hypothetical protein